LEALCRRSIASFYPDFVKFDSFAFSSVIVFESTHGKIKERGRRTRVQFPLALGVSFAEPDPTFGLRLALLLIVNLRRDGKASRPILFSRCPLSLTDIMTLNVREASPQSLKPGRLKAVNAATCSTKPLTGRKPDLPARHANGPTRHRYSQ
jgi:hypothetical protein